ncbi:MAG TPA: CaiB/BaiF CoA-transferase family protein [Acidimicrobiales bacterium]|nr:CaiB/BaiF CoA-transferase family protein [Acidimicrobiales bacterium]
MDGPGGGGPLEGLRVVELAGIGAAPFACTVLADLGADVLRLGRPRERAGDAYDQLTRSRDSVALDLKHPDGRALAVSLAARADALVESFRPGVAERLGVGPDDCLAANPRLVYARLTGYGQTGPLAARAGHDVNYLAQAGALWPVGRSGEPPVPPLNYVGDFGGALFCVVGVLAAVMRARETGVGQVVDAAMVDAAAMMTAMTHSFLSVGFWREERGVNILDTGAPFYDVYETSDHRYVAVGAIEPVFYAALLEGLGLAEADLGSQMDRDRWPQTKRAFARVFAGATRDEWVERFAGTDACVTAVLSPSEAVADAANAARGVFSEHPPAAPSPAPRFSGTPARVSSGPSTPGSGTDAGLARWGVDEAERARLRAAGAIA